MLENSHLSFKESNILRTVSYLFLRVLQYRVYSVKLAFICMKGRYHLRFTIEVTYVLEPALIE